MNFSGSNGIQGSLPQFSEITPRPNSVSTSDFTSNNTLQMQGQPIYTSTAGSSQAKQLLINSPNKYPGAILTWPDPSTLMQICEKQGIQAINIPNYTQNNTGILGVQPNTLPVRILPSVYMASSSQTDATKQGSTQKDEEKSESSNTESQSQLQHSVAMAEYLQKLQATTLPLTLQQLIKMQAEQVKKEKSEEEKSEQPQNSILNIPNVPAFRNSQQQTGNHFMTPENNLIAINPNDLNAHLESPQENESASNSKEQQIQTDSPKIERKMKFRAKTGEIKITVALDGSTLYCCPECSLAFGEKADIEQHIQAHIQERKYQCKECGAMLKRKEHLDQHMRGHSDERPFKCPVCQKAFKRNEHLTRHYVIHSGDKNFACSVCRKAFSRKDHLNKHTQTHFGIRRSKSKKDSVYLDAKDSLEKIMDAATTHKPDMSILLKDSTFVKQDSGFLQHIQNFQKDPNLLHTFSSFKEQAMKEMGVLSQQINDDANDKTKERESANSPIPSSPAKKPPPSLSVLNKTSITTINKTPVSLPTGIVNSAHPPVLSIPNEKPDSTITKKPDSQKDPSTTPTKNNPALSWLLSPFGQKLQIKPQILFKDRLGQLRDALLKFGGNDRDTASGKQLPNVGNGLLHVTGPNDSGFYTNRLEPAGFFGGNGWFANKGGILGGPGAILSTGSVLTDYPSAYKR
ncbi:uncharacterized protein [Prorops nasuta]|uniref:uncharacterized protein n=1 Tax=Prorops nasuta TaxID=863751 RepID=UPI0034CF1B2D